MPHFFVPPESIHGGQFTIEGDEVRHLLTVRRVKPGDTLRLFDGTGKVYVGRVEQAEKTAISGVILEEEIPLRSGVNLRLLVAVPKGDRFDWLVEKSAELGVTSVTPLVTQRSVVKDISEAKVQRWQRLSTGACQQCARPDIMPVEPPRSFSEAVGKLSSEALNLIPWEGEEVKTVKESWADGGSIAEVNVIIGPEGGFTLAEIEEARQRGCVPVTLGSRILRVETAGLLSAILVLDCAGEYGRK